MKKVLMVGPSVNLKGGIATVIKNYKDNKLNESVDIKYFYSVYTRNNLINIIAFPFLLIEYLITIIGRDIIHIHMASYGSFKRKSILISIAYLFKKNIIVHVHGAEFHKFYENSSDKYKRNIRETLNKAKYIIALSDEWKIRLSKITKTPIEVMYNSVNCPREKIYNENEKNIIFIGRMDERKGIYDLLSIAKNIEIFDPKIKILLCGDGEIEKIKSIVKNDELKNIEILGWIDERKKEETLRKTLINILPSYNEGMPMSILEAMSFGIPTIASNVGGIPEVISNRVNGFLIKPGDKEAMLNIIKEIVQQSEVRSSISKEAYATIKEKFDINKQIKKLINLYYCVH